MQTVEYNRVISNELISLKVSVINYGHRCGYINILEGADEYRELVAQACSKHFHGGVTYEQDDKFGFDTDHIGDGDIGTIQYVKDVLLTTLKAIKAEMSKTPEELEMELLRSRIDSDTLNEAFNTMDRKDFLAFAEREDYWWNTASLEELRDYCRTTGICSELKGFE